MTTAMSRLGGKPVSVVSLIVAASQTEIYGGERSAMAMLSALRAAGHDVQVVTTGGQSMRDLAAEHGLDTIHVTLKTAAVIYERGGVRDRLRKLVAFARDWLMLRKLFRQSGADVVHVNDISPAGQVGIPAARIAGLPCVIHIRTEVDSLRRLHRAMIWLAGASITVSPSVLKLHLDRIGHKTGGKRIRQRAIALQNGVDLDRFGRYDEAERLAARAKLAIASDAFVCLNVGSFEPRKRQHFMIDSVVAKLHDSVPNAETFFVGGTKSLYSEYLDRCRAAQEQLNNPSRCHLVSYSDQINDFYAACDVVVLGSLIEGLPRTVLEAMAAGRPVVATASPGAAELIVNRQNGFLIDPRDQGDEFAQALKCVALMTPEARATLGSVGRSIIENKYDVVKVARRFGEILEAVRQKRVAS